MNVQGKLIAHGNESMQPKTKKRKPDDTAVDVSGSVSPLKFNAAIKRRASFLQEVETVMVDLMKESRNETTKYESNISPERGLSVSLFVCLSVCLPEPTMITMTTYSSRK